jgi:hypothetical protein
MSEINAFARVCPYCTRDRYKPNIDLSNFSNTSVVEVTFFLIALVCYGIYSLFK